MSAPAATAHLVNMLHHPALRPLTTLTDTEADALRTVLVGAPKRGAGPWTIYSGTTGLTGAAERRLVRILRSLEPMGLVTLVAGASMGWDASMWGARLTCLGANAIYRYDAVDGGDVHSDCRDSRDGSPAKWGTDRCLACRARRPLDRPAYEAFVRALSPTDGDRQLNAPRLYCIEHGWVRRDDITTEKVCRTPGTIFHDGGLDRV